jgi:hypothetical protein
VLDPFLFAGGERRLKRTGNFLGELALDREHVGSASRAR